MDRQDVEPHHWMHQDLQGCAHCYAEVMTRRLNAMGLEKYVNGFNVTLHEECIEEPLAWKQPHTIFVCSMSDLFHIVFQAMPG